MFLHLVRVVGLCSVAIAAVAQTPPSPNPRAQQKSDSQTEQQTEPPKVESPKAEAPKPGSAGGPLTPAAVDPTSFVIGPEDVLYLQVWREPDFSRQLVVRPDGKITLPLVKEMQAAGKTPDALSQEIAKALSEYIKSPEVSVTVLQVNSKKYFITGEVNRPGSFPLAVPTTVLEALTNAGGFREFANLKKIVILRKGQRLKFNYKQVIKGKGQDQNILLENGDYIIVP